MERYIGDSASFGELMDAVFSEGTGIYADLDDLFSRRASRVESVLASIAAQ